MDIFNKTQSDYKENGRKSSAIENTTNDLLEDGKKLAGQLYDEGRDKMNNAEEQVQEYSDEILKTVQKNPLTSVLVAGAVGFILSALLKK